jgi:preprotein translocase subunit SecF
MHIFPLKLIPSKTKIDFVKLKKISFTLSILLSIVSFVLIAVQQFNFGIDFVGGVSIEVRTQESVDITQMRRVLNNLEIGEISIQNFGQDNSLSIRIGGYKQSISAEEVIDLVKNTLKNNFSSEFDYRKIDYVGPQVGNQLIKAGAMALLFSFLGIMIYIWIRFEWYFGLGVIIALVHDVILTLGFLSFTQIDFNLSTIAAILTIIGYSVNDSVVIYDRMRENFKKFREKTIDEVTNVSINETLSRTTLTVFSTLLANLALVIWGGEAIYSFSILVFFGIIAGTYSSIFISAPILTIFSKKIAVR